MLMGTKMHGDPEDAHGNKDAWRSQRCSWEQRN